MENRQLMIQGGRDRFKRGEVEGRMELPVHPHSLLINGRPTGNVSSKQDRGLPVTPVVAPVVTAVSSCSQTLLVHRRADVQMSSGCRTAASCAFRTENLAENLDLFALDAEETALGSVAPVWLKPYDNSNNGF